MKKKKIRFKMKGILSLALVFILLLGGCANQTENTPDTNEITQTEQESEGTEEAQAPQDQADEDEERADAGAVDKSVYMDPTQDVETRVEALLAQMTLEEKAAQLLQPEQSGLDPEDVKKYGIGSVLSGGGSAPQTGNKAQDWQNRINELKQAALDSRL